MVGITLEADGAYRGKDGGVASYGYLVKKSSETVRKDYNILLEDRVTNNYAEYMAVINGLEWIRESDLEFESLIIISDSQLVVKQVNGEWSVNSENMKDVHRRVRELIEYFERKNISVKVKHVDRENNVEADELSQLALEDHFLAKKLNGDDKKVCPECGEDMVVREGEYGKFWGCSGYPDCDHTEEYEED